MDQFLFIILISSHHLYPGGVVHPGKRKQDSDYYYPVLNHIPEMFVWL
jgi:hypothetical protein